MNNICFFHGAALMLIIRDDSFRSVKVYRDNGCSYLVNDVSGIYVKYSQKRLPPWSFTFAEDHVREITEMNKKVGNVYVTLVCDEDGICCLDWQEFSTIISIENKEYPKWVRISRLKNEKYSVWGKDGELKRKIGKSDFPRKILLNASNNSLAKKRLN